MEKTITPMPEPLVPQQERQGFATRVLLLSLTSLLGWLLIYYIFPQFEQSFPITRDISTAVQGVLFVGIAVVAMRRPDVLRLELFSFLAITMMLLGTALTSLAIQLDSKMLMVLCVTMQRICLCWFQIVVGMALMNSSPRALALVIVLGFLLSFVGLALVSMLPAVVNVWLFAILPVVCYLLALPLVKTPFANVCAAEPPVLGAITRPEAYLPFQNQLFIFILVFRVMCGFAMSFGEQEGTPLLTFLMPVVDIILALALVVLRWRLKADVLFLMSVLLITAGLLLVPLESGFSGGTVTDLTYFTSAILSSGTASFDILFWFLLVSTAARNPLAAVPVFAWGSALSCFGLIVGANLGRVANWLTLDDTAPVLLLSAGLLWLFVAYVLVGLRSFSFDAMISSIEQATPTKDDNIDPATLDGTCESIAERYSLTPREAEVFKLLARGRSGRYITEALQVSPNTVKAHVKHIYAKLDIHSNQELLDLLEQ